MEVSEAQDKLKSLENDLRELEVSAAGNTLDVSFVVVVDLERFCMLAPSRPFCFRMNQCLFAMLVCNAMRFSVFLAFYSIARNVPAIHLSLWCHHRPFTQGGSSELLKNLKADLKQKISELSALTSTSEVRAFKAFGAASAYIVLEVILVCDVFTKQQRVTFGVSIFLSLSTLSHLRRMTPPMFFLAFLCLLYCCIRSRRDHRFAAVFLVLRPRRTCSPRKKSWKLKSPTLRRKSEPSMRLLPRTLKSMQSRSQKLRNSR